MCKTKLDELLQRINVLKGNTLLSGTSRRASVGYGRFSCRDQKAEIVLTSKAR